MQNRRGNQLQPLFFLANNKTGIFQPSAARDFEREREREEGSENESWEDESILEFARYISINWIRARSRRALHNFVTDARDIS